MVLLGRSDQGNLGFPADPDLALAGLVSVPDTSYEPALDSSPRQAGLPELFPCKEGERTGEGEGEAVVAGYGQIHTPGLAEEEEDTNWPEVDKPVVDKFVVVEWLRPVGSSVAQDETAAASPLPSVVVAVASGPVNNTFR